jgi:chitinase
MALGGGGAPGTLNSENDAKGVAYSLWNSYGNPQFKDSGDNSPRPFGDVFVNGFDIDVEKSDGNTYYQYMINELRSYFERDTANQYYITGAPQCPLPEANMETMIEHAQFDYLWVQFYNNEQNCDAAVYVYGPKYEGATFNYDAWIDYVKGTPSENAKFLVGIPASSTAAHSVSYIQPPDLPKLIDYVKNKPQFSGIMFWEASESDKYSKNGCNFAQEVRSVLDTGSTC